MHFRLADALSSTETLFPAVKARLPRVAMYVNDPDWQRRTDQAYNARTVNWEPLILGRLPNNSTLRSNYFVLECGGQVAAESVPHVMRDHPELMAQAITAERPTAQIEQECFLLARYGHGTWGHWLGEILPLAALIERRYPGRFLYATPTTVSWYNSVVRESLRAYGIEAARIIPVSPDKTTHLLNTWAITPIWTDMAPHPAAMDIMRGSVRLGAFRPEMARVALMRRDWKTRGIANGVDVESLLRARGFTITDANGMPFVDQVRMYQTATTIFAVIGSGLTGIIYSPNHVNIAAAGPAGWGDRFFYALAQHRNARWAEIRGRTAWDGKTGLLRDAPFEVPIEALAEAVMRLEACDT